MNPEDDKKPPMHTADQHMLMGILSYLGPLVIVSFIMSKNEPFVKFHIKQGFVLLSIEVIIWILGSILWLFWPIVSMINLIVFILSIIGIVNVVHHREKELPLVGQFSKYFKF